MTSGGGAILFAQLALQSHVDCSKANYDPAMEVPDLWVLDAFVAILPIGEK